MNRSEHRFSSRSRPLSTILSRNFPTRQSLPANSLGIIARYSAVLEGNFIYWMTAASIAAKAEEVRPILAENLFEEVRDSHPAMLRRFAIAAQAFPPTQTRWRPTSNDSGSPLSGKLQGSTVVLTMPS